MTAAALQYLVFDQSEDEHGHGTFDAMAAVAPAQLPALTSELQTVLDWAHSTFGPPAPLDEGAEWDCELQGVQETATPLEVRYRPGEGMALQPGRLGEPRVTLSITLTGTPAFCAALRDAFDLD
jgi:hypothetical protein